MSEPLNAYVEDDPDSVLIEPDGTIRRGANVFLTEGQYKMMRQGYLCPWCLQRLRSAFKLTCGEWHYGPKNPSVDEWQAYMDEEYRGEEHLGATKAQIDAYEDDIWTPGAT